MTWQVRRATREDAAGLARVQVATWRTTYGGIVPESFLAEMDAGKLAQRWTGQWADVAKHIFVAIDEGEGEDAGSVCGFACGGKIRVPVEGFDGELYAIYLLKDWQGLGVGRRLLAALAESLGAAMPCEVQGRRD
jgi:ribosomal protein S18 acetylase RimI-like enzyme